MSCPSYNQHRGYKLAKTSAMVSLFLMNPLYAALIESSNVESSQYQPLSASINVSDIKNPDNFSVALANQQIYQQMGLTPNPTMSADFVKTSANSGKIILNTRIPLSDPFADVVLTVNDAGTQVIVPKTLLLPLGGALQPVTMSSTDHKDLSAAANNNQTPELTLGQPILGQPLPINDSLPPPLRILSVTPQFAAAQEDASSKQIHARSRISTKDNINKQASTPSTNIVSPLTINVQRTYQTRSTETKSQKELVAQNSIARTPTSESFSQANIQTDEQSSVLQAATKIRTTITKIVPHVKASKESTTTASAILQNNNHLDIHHDTHIYTVQKNDNLWTIANQIAKENGLKIRTVIQQIKSHNPHAFENNDESMLKLNAKLKLPENYVIPENLGINGAIAERKAQLSTALGSKLNKELNDKSQSTHHLTANNGLNSQTNNKQMLSNTSRMQMQSQRLADLEKRLNILSDK